MSEYIPKDYIVQYNKTQRESLEQTLSEYGPRFSDLLPLAYVKVDTVLQEKSLLECLAKLPDVTYREGIEHKLLGDRNV